MYPNSTAPGTLTNVKSRSTQFSVLGTLLPNNITNAKSGTTPVPVVETLLPINITNVKSSATPVPVVGTNITAMWRSSLVGLLKCLAFTGSQVRFPFVPQAMG